uniref:Uncharacterized protein n=1 Tax=Marseillevirus LCMAC103 TaxID=2506604 RepID=A0A481YUW8_9VIRU|nr:MAG: hypothetical protein LCMAC103_02370 [Marseillevirus LCMAC103]
MSEKKPGDTDISTMSEKDLLGGEDEKNLLDDEDMWSSAAISPTTEGEIRAVAAYKQESQPTIFA